MNHQWCNQGLLYLIVLFELSEEQVEYHVDEFAVWFVPIVSHMQHQQHCVWQRDVFVNLLLIDDLTNIPRKGNWYIFNIDPYLGKQEDSKGNHRF